MSCINVKFMSTVLLIFYVHVHVCCVCTEYTVSHVMSSIQCHAINFDVIILSEEINCQIWDDLRGLAKFLHSYSDIVFSSFFYCTLQLLLNLRAFEIDYLFPVTEVH